MLRAFLLVGLGGAAGSILRYAVHLWVGRTMSHPFPIATFAVNMVGCFLIGVFFGLSQRAQWMQGDGWLLLATGLCGGFTTFSAFALDNVGLLEKQQTFTAVVYTSLSVFMGIAACRAGIWLLRP